MHIVEVLAVSHRGSGMPIDGHMAIWQSDLICYYYSGSGWHECCGDGQLPEYMMAVSISRWVTIYGHAP